VGARLPAQNPRTDCKDAISAPRPAAIRQQEPPWPPCYQPPQPAAGHVPACRSASWQRHRVPTVRHRRAVGRSRRGHCRSTRWASAGTVSAGRCRTASDPPSTLRHAAAESDQPRYRFCPRTMP
jgi:hypothetical protein